MLVAEPFKLDQIFSKLGGLARAALAVSGGSDSIAMLRMVHEWASALDHYLEIFVLTVDHGLREEAAAEAVQVARWCAGLGVSHQILQWQHDGVKSGIQAKARTARYDLMAAWCLANDVPILLTAHTADDQAETVAMRLSRTDSLHSLAGIWPEREWQGTRVLRPLLKMRREELRVYLRRVGQEWIDDPSNDDQQFERVRMRKVLGGELHDLNTKADAAQESVGLLTLAIAKWWSNNIEIHQTGFLTLQREALSKLDQVEFDQVIARMIDLCGSPTRHAEREERLSLQIWLHDPKMGRRTLGGALFSKRKGILIAARESGRIGREPVVFGANQVLDWDGRFRMKGPVGAHVMPLRDLPQVARRKEIPAFIQAGLPAIVENGLIWSIPHLGVGQAVEIKFLRH